MEHIIKELKELIFSVEYGSITRNKLEEKLNELLGDAENMVEK